MEDLEKLLLEAVGRTDSDYKQSRRHPQDDDSDSKDDDSDSDHAYLNTRKPLGPQIPLKKRPDPTEKDSTREEDDHGGDSNDDSVGSDLYKNEHDREELSRLTELEREMILSERATKKDDKKLQEVVRSKKPKPGKEPARIRGVRSSVRSADRSAAKDYVLNELRAKRLKQQDSTKSSWRKPVASDNSSSSNQSVGESVIRSEDEDFNTAGKKPNPNPKPSDSDDEQSGRDVPSFEDIKDITIRRSKLEKWFMEPYFDELIVGCFVRVGIGKSRSGSIYRLCMVRNVDASDPNCSYEFAKKKRTHKCLNCVWGREGFAAKWQMTMVSDSSPREDEFEEWLAEAERNGGRVPTKRDVSEKKDSIEKSSSFVYSAATVRQMLEQNKSARVKSGPFNIAVERERLKREMDMAESKGDMQGVETFRKLIEELEAKRKSQVEDSKAVRLSEMNRRNRVENFRNASGLKPVNTGLRSGEAGYDPFSRRWTRSMNYYVSKPASNLNPAMVVGNVAAVPGVAATAAALEAAADAGKLVDTNAPVDLGTESNSLHNFDLPISLARFQRSGGVQAGFMARKQRIEATMGCKVPEDDGRRHALTLTVSDYKRRRGLL